MKTNINTDFRLLNEWLYITYDEQSASHISNLHYHNAYEMFVVTSGSSNMLVDDHMIHTQKGNIVLIKPNSLHKNNGGARHSRYALHFTDKYLNTYFASDVTEGLTKLFNNEKFSIKQEEFGKILELLGRIYSGDKFSYIHLAEILSIISRPDSIIHQTEYSDKTVNSILEYINKHYNEILGLDDIANALCISKPYMCNIFKKETSVTISHYLNSVRINQACDILRLGGKNITETALMCGYSSPMYFCRMFKSIVNMTPNEYRKYIIHEQP